MSEHRFLSALLEPLEPRIAPALVVFNPLLDLTVGPGKTGADIDLSRLFDPFITDNGHTIVTLNTNFDADAEMPGMQASAPIVIEMLDDEAPLSVQNFLGYLTNPDTATNYVGTFFHRAVSGFVLQGGGFKVSTPETHIPTPFDVHNEFDLSRSNLEGTIAMAKTGLGPNTATSEWFINVANNAANLDNQNGGFTVFARVLSGLDVAKAIIALPTLTRNGSATLTPVQNYDPDPDLNPNTPPPDANPENLVTITAFTITPPPRGNPGGNITYTFDVVDATTGQPSDIVTGSVTGTNLHLSYKAHAAAVVNVTVHGSDDAESSASDTFTINLQPNLVANFEGDPFDGIIIGGDTKTVPIVVGNNGGGAAVGKVDVKVYLSEVRRTGTDGNGNPTGPDPFGVLVQPDADILLAEFASEEIDIAGGAAATLMKTLEIPKQLVTMSGGVYRVLIEVTPAGDQIQERFADDNVSFDGQLHAWENRFGTFSVSGFGDRTNAKLLYQEADGDVVKLSVTRKGSGQVAFDGSIADLTVTNSKAGSVLNATLISDETQGERDIDLHNVEIVNFIDTVNFSKVALTGFLSATRGLLHLHVGDVSGDGTLTIGKLPAGTPGRPELTFRSVTDFSIDSLVRIRSLRATEWLDAGGVKNRIDAPSIGSLAIVGRDGEAPIRGDLEATVRLTGRDSLGSMQVAGFLRNASVVTTGNVGEVSVGGLDHADIFVGVNTRPDEASDFAQVRSLGSISVRGVPGSPDAFLDSNVAAARIGAVFVTGIDGGSGEKRFGIVADAIKSYNRGNVVTTGKLSEPQTFDKRGKYSVLIV